MADEKDTLPSDAESGSLKPQPARKPKPPAPADDEKAEQDPSEQPS